MPEKISVASHLTDDEYKYFLETYSAHNRCMGVSERVKYNLSEIVKVEREKNHLRVYYSNGEWWIYTKQRTWY